ncbi:zinc ribbon domain-containing protein [Paenibacillus sp. GCM10027627]|uniref:zinc ribbon domain-containing protein n=1 Tax=unclassified Paenibacillus TaxID=185978 RepID=UPI0036458EA7
MKGGSHIAYHFTKRIKCLDCNKNYKSKIERNGKIVYICSGYANYGLEFCSRWKVDQNLILELIYNHYEIELLKSGKVDGSKKGFDKPQIAVDLLLDRLDNIEVSPKSKSLKIHFRDATNVMLTPDRQTYHSEE